MGMAREGLALAIVVLVAGCAAPEEADVQRPDGGAGGPSAQAGPFSSRHDVQVTTAMPASWVLSVPSNSSGIRASAWSDPSAFTDLEIHVEGCGSATFPVVSVGSSDFGDLPLCDHLAAGDHPVTVEVAGVFMGTITVFSS